MADQPRHPDTGGDTGMRRDREGLPRWVKVSLTILAVVVLLIVIVMLLFSGGTGGHGPSRHF